MFLWEKIKLLLILVGVELYNVHRCYAIFNTVKYLFLNLRFESSVKSYDTKTAFSVPSFAYMFESSVKSTELTVKIVYSIVILISRLTTSEYIK